MTDEGLDLIKLYEGYSPSAYLCPAAHWTIGYGAIWGLDGTRVTEDHPDINEEQAYTSTLRGWAVQCALLICIQPR